MLLIALGAATFVIARGRTLTVAPSPALEAAPPLSRVASGVDAAAPDGGAADGGTDGPPPTRFGAASFFAEELRRCYPVAPVSLHEYQYGRPYEAFGRRRPGVPDRRLLRHRAAPLQARRWLDGAVRPRRRIRAGADGRDDRAGRRASSQHQRRRQQLDRPRTGVSRRWRRVAQGRLSQCRGVLSRCFSRAGRRCPDR